MMTPTDYDAVVVGSGPNGLAAAITLQKQGKSVFLLEAKDSIGGGMRTAELTLPGFRHDICSAIHPMAVMSPFFSRLPLEQFGLDYLYPEVAAAHPFDDGTAAALSGTLEQTAASLGTDGPAYRRLLEPVINSWQDINQEILGPLQFPRRPLDLAAFGLKALLPASSIARRFRTEAAKGLWAGMAAHSIRPLEAAVTAAIGLVLLSAGHIKGWPAASGGSESLAKALGAYFISLGGNIQTGITVRSLKDLPSSKAVLFDLTPRQLLAIAGHKFSSTYSWQLERYRYGMGVFKVDWALDEQVPFTAAACRKAGTVHLGGTFSEIALGERETAAGKQTKKPFVLLAQQSIFDNSRAPEGKHTLWGYCHVPHGSKADYTAAIEAQVERFAPGFRERIIGRHVMSPTAMEAYNPNYIGGDINGGQLDPTQLFTRPALRWSPYRTSAKGIYICSASTPPGGGVHGMGGYHAARRALKDIFGISTDLS
ncbi:phytoene desaturase family protein [Flavihumibacter petaseus]|uniref:Putative oxidoreductase n=1 Tax=Flavihumibacter petaseus NBRC 106054 TaxID=1220578 RepID=A0A0E9MY42_9BACT|nr:NAD(P)/FAD-dependent oxidoreductase [Flavihumibacter petaseus]GAO42499.1 putative oxidoreductase [Flavihumibacter petaseus NBRC 106054]